MTLAEIRGVKKQKEEVAAAAAPPEAAHPGPREYVRVAMALAVVEVLELVVYYLGVLGSASIPLLAALTVIQFSLVAMWFMHLRFDSRLLTTLFVGGIILAITLFLVVLAAFRVYFA